MNKIFSNGIGSQSLMSLTGKVLQVATNGTSLNIGKIDPPSISTPGAGRIMITNDSTVPTWLTDYVGYASFYIQFQTSPTVNANAAAGNYANTIAFKPNTIDDASSGFGSGAPPLTNIIECPSTTTIQVNYAGLWKISLRNMVYVNGDGVGGTILRMSLVIDGVPVVPNMGYSNAGIASSPTPHNGEWVRFLNAGTILGLATTRISGTGSMNVNNGGLALELISTTA